MSKNAMIPCAAALISALVAAAPMADGGSHNTTTATAVDSSLAGIAGVGYGSLGIPTYTTKGFFNAVLQDDEAIDRFAINATMNRYIPHDTVGPPLFQIGGISGVIRPLPPPGVHTIMPLPPIGYVEGIWRLEANNLGSFKLQTYLRASETDEAVLAGYIAGDFYMQDDGIIHPPMGPPPGQPVVGFDASQVRPPQGADFSGNGFCGTGGCRPPVLFNGSAQVQRQRPASAIGAQGILGEADFDGHGAVGSASSGISYMNGSNADWSRVRAKGEIGAHEALGLADFDSHGAVGSVGSGIISMDGSSAQVSKVRTKSNMSAGATSGVVTLDGSSAQTDRVRAKSNLGAGTAPNLASLDGSSAQVSKVRTKSNMSAGATSGVVTLDGSSAQTDRVRAKSNLGAGTAPNFVSLDGADAQASQVRTKLDLGAQQSLGLGDFDEIPDGDDEPALQQGRLRLRYVLFR